MGRGKIEWSFFPLMKALCHLVFLLSLAALQAQDLPTVVIHEIHYHHDDPLTPAEFIELVNAGDAAADLSGWSFSEGIDHVFPTGTVLEAGAYYVLAQDERAYNAAFGSIFQGGIKANAAWDAGELANGGETLTLRDASDRVVDTVDYRDAFPWPVSPDGEGASLELINAMLDNDLSGHWRSSPNGPTPGKANGAAVENAPPAVRQVNHSPMAPVSGEAVHISAKVTDADGVAGVFLHIQGVAPGAYLRLTDAGFETDWESFPMRDDGTGGDDEAGDSIYVATVPEEWIAHRHLVRFRVEAMDALGNMVRLPYEDDPTPNRAFFTYDGVPSWQGSISGEAPRREFTTEELTMLPVYHLIADATDVERCQYQSSSETRRFRGTLVYDGVVYDHIEFKIRGEFSTYQCGKNKWKFFFNRGANFAAKDNYGIVYKGGFRIMNFSACASPWVPANRGMSGLDESVGFRLHGLAGVPSPRTHHVHFRVIDEEAESSGSQYDSDLWGLYLSQEHPDGRFVSRNGLPDGSTFKIESGNGDQKHAGPIASDYGAFVSQSRRTQTAEWWRTNMHLDSYYSFRAINRAISNIDIREGWNHYFYHHPNGQWYPIPWDLDMTYMPETHWSGVIDAKNCLNVDALAIEFSSRCREIMDLLLSDRAAGGGQVGSVVEEIAQWLGTQKAWIPVASIEKTSTMAVVTTREPHGYTTGDRISIVGVSSSGYNGDHEVEVIDDKRFSYSVSIFAATTVQGDAIQAGKAVGQGSAWSEIDAAMWNHHPRTTGGHEGNFFRTPTRQGFRGGDLERLLSSADFSGFAEYVKDFTTNTDPDDFQVGDGDQRGYGYNYVALEADDGMAPDQPVITFAGGEGYPVDDLRFVSSAFAGGSLFQTQTFAGMQWRIGELYNPETPDYEPGTPWRYEIEPLWVSDTLDTFEEMVQVPVKVIRPGGTYRARVRHRNQLGGWSHWSEPITFIAGEPDLTPYQDLVISELMYHPGVTSTEERAAGYRRNDFEYVELYNRGNQAIDLSPLRFTKGVEFDFNKGVLEPGEMILVVAHPEAMAFRHGEGLPVAGAYEGRLANGGERLKLSYGAGTAVIDFEFEDRGDWPAEGDGSGMALELAMLEAHGDLSLGSAWVAQAPSPGKVASQDAGDGDDIFQITRVEREAEAFRIDWRSVLGQRYAVDFSPQLEGWEAVGEVEATGHESTFRDETPGRVSVATGYYRVREIGSEP